MDDVVKAIIGIVVLCVILYCIYKVATTYMSSNKQLDSSLKKFITKLNKYTEYQFYPITSGNDRIAMDAAYICIGSGENDIGLMILMHTIDNIGGTVMISDDFASSSKRVFISEGKRYIFNNDGLFLNLGSNLVESGTYLLCFEWIKLASNLVHVNTSNGSSSSGSSKSIDPVEGIFCYKSGNKGSIMAFKDMTQSKYFIFVAASFTSSNERAITDSLSSSSDLSLQYSSSNNKVATIKSNGVYASDFGKYAGVFSSSLIQDNGRMICINY